MKVYSSQTSKETLARQSEIEGGIHTFGAQTHPADGNVGIIVTNKERAQVLRLIQEYPFK